MTRPRLRRPPRVPRRAVLPLLLAAVVVIGVLSVVVGPGLVPPSLVVLPLLGGYLWLSPRPMRVLALAALASLLVDIVVLGPTRARAITLLNVVAAAAVGIKVTRLRERVGVGGARREGILVELRERLRRHGDLPPLPPGWHAEVAMRSAGGGSFGGDFLVAVRSSDGRRVDIALVDVSGKGVDVGSRALLLSGALGGLLGAVPPDRFLAAANDYLYRQGWEEGFATAAYLEVDLGTGRYSLRSAGHPPVALFDAGSGRWVLSPASGPLLGILPEVEHVPDEGVLHPHDALVLYTDGLVETPGRALDVGIDRLLGEAERLVPRGFTGGAQYLITRVAAGGDDDRALLLLWRD
jgi:hypothetical protein